MGASLTLGGAVVAGSASAGCSRADHGPGESHTAVAPRGVKVIVAGDHYTADLAQRVVGYLESEGIDVKNVGAVDNRKVVKLEEIIPAVIDAVRGHRVDSGILLCGTGSGVEIGANKFKGIRASLCTSPKQAEFARVYDNANVLCLGSWLTTEPDGILHSWLTNEFDGDAARASMLAHFDNWT